MPSIAACWPDPEDLEAGTHDRGPCAAIHAARALLPQGWAADLRLEIRAGRIAALTAAAGARAGDMRVDTLLPAPANLHSHSFQRAMAGLGEYRMPGQDSFWSWREAMYRLANRLTPEQAEAIAAFAFMEMQEAGFAAVGEFHYLHHQKGGAPYADPAEMARRMEAAAQQSGIGLTLLPVLYSRGGARGAALSPAQARFGHDVEGYLGLLAALRAAGADRAGDMRIGIAPHSLRAITPADLAALLASGAGGERDGPVHIHIAEQEAEVAMIESWLGARPVEWLLANAPVAGNWCLVHATHMRPDELRNLAATGAVAGLCPITEANLGDGIFDGTGWIGAGGRFGLGTDSNISITLSGEIRMLEYSQRLRDRARNRMNPGPGSLGEALFLQVARGGAQALGRDAGRIETGRLADLVALDTSRPSLAALPPERIMDGLVFACESLPVTDLWSAGRHRVREGAHIARGPITRRWRQAVSALSQGT